MDRRGPWVRRRDRLPADGRGNLHHFCLPRRQWIRLWQWRRRLLPFGVRQPAIHPFLLHPAARMALCEGTPAAFPARLLRLEVQQQRAGRAGRHRRLHRADSLSGAAAEGTGHHRQHLVLLGHLREPGRHHRRDRCGRLCRAVRRARIGLDVGHQGRAGHVRGHLPRTVLAVPLLRRHREHVHRHRGGETGLPGAS
ncbi:hypothetical protein FQZ97_677980 [compost metagenome]